MALFTVVSPLYTRGLFFGHATYPLSVFVKETGTSSNTVAHVIIFFSIAGAYTEIGFSDEPGERFALVAKLNARFDVFCPLPPDIAHIAPVFPSIITAAESGVPSALPGKLDESA